MDLWFWERKLQRRWGDWDSGNKRVTGVGLSPMVFVASKFPSHHVAALKMFDPTTLTALGAQWAGQGVVSDLGSHLCLKLILISSCNQMSIVGMEVATDAAVIFMESGWEAVGLACAMNL